MANDPNAEVPKAKTDWAKQIPTVLYGVIALAILGLIGWGLAGRGGFLESLGNKEIARGLITFLIAFTTVGIAVILAVSTMFGYGDKGEGEEADKRFDRGKQVLTALIGVLGTIVGFYFGSSIEKQPTPAVTQAQGLAIAPTNLSNSQPKKGEKITISSFVYGGKPPYTYSITFDTPLIPAVKDIASADGSIKQEIAMPSTLNKDTDVKFQITVKDSENRTADYNKDGTQKIAMKAK